MNDRLGKLDTECKDLDRKIDKEREERIE